MGRMGRERRKWWGGWGIGKSEERGERREKRIKK